MKAIVFTEPNKMVVENVPDPVIAPDEVLLRSKACGICRSDFDLLEGDYIIPLHWPIIPGHEYSGEIVEVGKQVTGYKVGDRVVGECAVGCGTCELCTSGKVNACPTGDHFGFTIDGAFAELVKVKASWLHKLPDNLSFVEGALVEPFTVGYYALEHIGGVDGSDTVLVMGAGVIGLSTLLASKGKGARTILVDNQQKRLDTAMDMGADEVINTATDDLVEAVMEKTKGKGADVVVEAVGVDPLMQKLFDVVASTGRVSITGINFNDKLETPLHKITAKELTVKGNIGSPFVWDRALTFLSNVKPDLAKLCTHKYRLDEAHEAFEMANRPGEAVKVQILPT